MRINAFFGCTIIALALLQGCAKKPMVEPAAPLESEQPFYHTVKHEGESISLIAKWYTGSINNWSAVASLNPDIQPTKLTVGDTLKIPKDLIVTKEPLGPEFLRSELRKAKPSRMVTEEKAAPEPTPTATPEDPSPATEELIKTRDDLWRELMGE